MNYIRLLMLCLIPTCSLAANMVKFSSTVKESSSPNKVFSLYNEDHDAEPNHTLFLKVKSTNVTKKVLDFGRQIDVAWSPNSKAFFVTDYAESDSANCIVIKLPNLDRMDVKHLLLKKSSEKNIFKNHHLYVRCNRWEDIRHVEVEVSGYGDENPNGFKRKYSLDI